MRTTLLAAAIAVLIITGGMLIVPSRVLGLIGVALGAIFAVLLIVIGGLQTEKVLAGYWIAFCLFSTLLSDYVINGMFNVFLLAMIAGAVFRTTVEKVRVDPIVLLLFFALLFSLVASIFNLPGTLTSLAIDRILVVVVAIIVSLQLSSRRGVQLVTISITLSSLAVAFWVIVSAAQSNFSYRGHVDVNQNVASYYIGIGFMLVLGKALASVGRKTMASYGAAARVVALLVMGYGLTLLASRGSFVAIAISILFAILYAMATRAIAIRGLAVIPIIIGVAMLLPGSSGLLDRFEDPDVISGNGRTQIWQVAIDSVLDANVEQLLLGYGMNASADVIRHEMPYLTSTHSSYVNALHNHGLIGLLLLLALHVAIFVRLLRLPSIFAFPLLMVLIFQMAVGLFMTATDDYLYWTSLGFMAGCAALLHRPEANAFDPQNGPGRRVPAP